MSESIRLEMYESLPPLKKYCRIKPGAVVKDNFTNEVIPECFLSPTFEYMVTDEYVDHWRCKHVLGGEPGWVYEVYGLNSVEFIDDSNDSAPASY